MGAQGWDRGRGGRLRKCEWNNEWEMERDNCRKDVLLSVWEQIYLDGKGKYHMSLLSKTNVWFCVSDSGVGAGIDSYYEYLLKAYILLGDDMFLQRFNIVSNLIFPCLHNSICSFSSLYFSLYLLEVCCLFETEARGNHFRNVFTKLLLGCRINVVWGLKVCVFCLALRLHNEVH